MKSKKLLTSLMTIPILSLTLLNTSVRTSARSNVVYVTKPVYKTTTTTTTTTGGYELRVIQLCNVQRARYGLPALSQDSKLMQLCKLKSQDMAYRDYFSHNSPVYGSAFNMMKIYGVKFVAAGENIAEGQPTPDAVVTSWMNSAGHRANILNKDYKEIGVGIATDRYGRLVWTQMFIKER